MSVHSTPVMKSLSQAWWSKTPNTSFPLVCETWKSGVSHSVGKLSFLSGWRMEPGAPCMLVSALPLSYTLRPPSFFKKNGNSTPLTHFPRLALKVLCNPGRLWTHDFPSLISKTAGMTGFFFLKQSFWSHFYRTAQGLLFLLRQFQATINDRMFMSWPSHSLKELHVSERM